MDRAFVPLRRLLMAAGIAAVSAMIGCPLGVVAQDVPHATLPQCQAGDPDLLLPDVTPDPPRDVREIYSGPRRYLQFTTAVGNIGDGPLLLEGRTVSTPGGLVTQAYQRIRRRDGSECARPAGQFEFLERHRHWHFEHFVGYDLRRDDPVSGPLVAGGAKTSFCLLDLEHVTGFQPSRFPRQLGIVTCESPEDLQGISVGWKDVYESILPGQSILLDPDPDHQVPPGTYYLTFVADPDHVLWEKDTGNNISSILVGVTLPPLPMSGSLSVVELPTGRPRPPRLRPPRFHLTRPARPGRGPLLTPVAPPPTRPTPTPTPVGAGPGPASCDNACSYSVSQLHLTWYDALGLRVAGVINAGVCPPLDPDAGEAGTIQMSKWLAGDSRDTGLDHHTGFVLDTATHGDTDNGGGVAFRVSGQAVNFTYTAPVRPLARAADLANFPVVFEMCLTVGDHAVKMRMVCQPKATGMLCHK